MGVLFAQIIDSAEFYEESNDSTYCPTAQNTIHDWFQETIQLRTKMLFAPHNQFSEIYVEVKNTYVDENGNPQFQTYIKNNKLTDNPCPENSFYYIIVPGRVINVAITMVIHLVLTYIMASILLHSKRGLKMVMNFNHLVY